MRKFIATAVATTGVLAAVSAQAADMPARAPVARAPVAFVATPSWTGFYVGLFAGYGWGRARATEPTDLTQVFPFYNGTDVPYSFDTPGFFGGGTVGYNVQSGAFIYGLEGEVGYLGLRGSEIDPNGTIFFGTPDTVTTFKSDVYGAIYGRFGLASGNGLFYGKGGVAFLNAKGTTIDPCAGTPSCGTSTLAMSGSKVMIGWSAGGGIEWMFGGNWSAKVEYAYFDFGKLQTSGGGSDPGLWFQDIKVTAHTAKVGVNYRFGGPVVARY